MEESGIMLVRSSSPSTPPAGLMVISPIQKRPMAVLVSRVEKSDVVPSCRLNPATIFVLVAPPKSILKLSCDENVAQEERLLASRFGLR